jgi:hypothetical protein
MVNVAPCLLPCLEEAFKRGGGFSRDLQHQTAQPRERLLCPQELQAGLAGNFLRQGLIGGLNVAAQTLLNKRVDPYSAEQDNANEEQVDREQASK